MRETKVVAMGSGTTASTERRGVAGTTLAGIKVDGEFRAVWTPFEDRGAEGLALPVAAMKTLEVTDGDSVFSSSVS
jgi:hypothetical protein